MGASRPRTSYPGAGLVLRMARRLGTDCPCGFSFTTPHGEEDAVAVVQMHLRRVHGKVNVSREEALAAVKTR